MNPNTNKNQSSNCNEHTKYDFVPVDDLEMELELAMNEPLPEVKPLDDYEEFQEDIGELENIDELLENFDSEDDNKLAEKLLNDTLGCYSIETPIKRSQVIYTSLPSETSKKIEKKRQTENADLGVGKLSLFTPVKTKPSESLPVPKEKISSKELNKFESSETPINHMKMNILPTNSQKKTFTFRTPIQPGSLIKRRETNVTSMIPQLQRPIDTTFSKLVVRGTVYLNLKVLGKGGSSTVYQCFDVTAKENRAIKCVDLDSPSHESFLKEIDCLSRLQRFDRVIRLYDFEHVIKEKKLYVVMEMGSADLSQILKNLSKNKEEMAAPYLILFYWMEMLRAVRQIHSEGTIHSDLKPANFLLVDGKLKLIDFGISSSIQNDSTSVIKTVSEGTGNYISPEALNCEYSNNISSPNFGKPKYKISFKSDVWSLGCILYQLVYKRAPFQHITPAWQKLMVIANPKVSVEYPQDYKVPTKFISTIKRCLIFDAKSRASVDDLIAEYEHFDV